MGEVYCKWKRKWRRNWTWLVDGGTVEGRASGAQESRDKHPRLIVFHQFRRHTNVAHNLNYSILYVTEQTHSRDKVDNAVVFVPSPTESDEVARQKQEADGSLQQTMCNILEH